MIPLQVAKRQIRTQGDQGDWVCSPKKKEEKKTKKWKKSTKNLTKHQNERSPESRNL